MGVEETTLRCFFNNMNAHITDIWLESCITWLKSEVLQDNYTVDDLKSQVYKQWLLTDLRDLEHAVLPPGLSQKEYFTLLDTCSLQIMEVVDVSKPKLWQLQRIRNTNVLTRDKKSDADEVGTGKRMLQLKLTDGVQEVIAMEYKPISCLNVNLSPGMKIKIIGPVTVRKGRLMLEPRHVKVLGGEVEDLLILNATENILARALNLPENPAPARIQDALFTVERQDNNEGYTRVNTSSVLARQPPIALPPKDETKINLLDEDDDLFMASVVDNVLAKAQSQEPKPQRITTLQPKITNSYHTQFDEDDEIDALLEVENEMREIPVNTPEFLDDSAVEPKANTSRSLNTFISDDFFNNIDIDEQVKIAEEKSYNVITLEKLIRLKDIVGSGNFYVNAKFKEVSEKLQLLDGAYKLVIEISDSTGVLIVQVHSDILVCFSEVSAGDIISLKTSVMNGNTEAVDAVMAVLEKIRNKIIQVDGVLQIRLERGKLPVITKVI